MNYIEQLDNEPGEKKYPSIITFCAKCRHFGGSLDDAINLCKNPRFGFPPEYDYVSGVTLNETKPKCVDINQGDCPGYSASFTWPTFFVYYWFFWVPTVVIFFSVLAWLTG